MEDKAPEDRTAANYTHHLQHPPSTPPPILEPGGRPILISVNHLRGGSRSPIVPFPELHLVPVQITPCTVLVVAPEYPITHPFTSIFAPTAAPRRPPPTLCHLELPPTKPPHIRFLNLQFSHICPRRALQVQCCDKTPLWQHWVSHCLRQHLGPLGACTPPPLSTTLWQVPSSIYMITVQPYQKSTHWNPQNSNVHIIRTVTAWPPATPHLSDCK